MKTRQYKIRSVLALALATGLGATAQLNDAPGATEYTKFSRFITERNIFDPSRQPHAASNQNATYRPKVARSAPAFTLVGTMHYEKGMFAFFDGNNPDLRKVLYESDSNSIAGYNVSEITLAGVKLQTADKKSTVQLKIGDMMRQEGSEWRMAETGGPFTGAAGNISPGAADSSADTAPAASPLSAPNDTLKKLMQQREQELK